MNSRTKHVLLQVAVAMLIILSLAAAVATGQQCYTDSQGRLVCQSGGGASGGFLDTSSWRAAARSILQPSRPSQASPCPRCGKFHGYQQAQQQAQPGRSDQPAQQSSSRTALPSTVRVIHDSGPDARGYGNATHGNGSLIAIDDTRGRRCGLILSCNHLRKADWKPRVRFPGGEVLATVLLGSESPYDVALFEVAGIPQPSHILPLAAEPAPVGATVQWEGYVGRAAANRDVLGYEIQRGSGAITEYQGVILRAAGRTMDGQSGGPVYNEDGLQTVISQADDGDGRQWHLTGPSVAWIRKWIAEQGIRLDGVRYSRGGDIRPTKPEEPLLVPVQPVNPERTALVLPGPAELPEAGEIRPARPPYGGWVVMPPEWSKQLVETKKTHVELEAGIESLKTQLNDMATKPGLADKKGDRGPLADVAPDVPIITNPPIEEESGGGIPWGLLGLVAAGALGGSVPTWAVMAWRGVRAIRQFREARGPTTNTEYTLDFRKAAAPTEEPSPAPPETAPGLPGPCGDQGPPGAVGPAGSVGEQGPPGLPQEAPVTPIVVDAPPAAERHHIKTEFINVESDHWRRANERARQEIARRYPGSQDILEAELSLTRQFAAGMPQTQS